MGILMKVNKYITSNFYISYAKCMRNLIQAYYLGTWDQHATAKFTQRLKSSNFLNLFLFLPKVEYRYLPFLKTTLNVAPSIGGLFLVYAAITN